MRKIILMMLVGSLCLSLCACGGKQTANTEGTVSQQETTNKKENDETTKEEKQLTQIALGDKITLDFAEITVDESGIKEDIKQSIKTGNITYKSGPDPVSGSKYVYMKGTLKNISKSEISNVDVGGTVVIDGYSYDVESINIIETNGESVYNLASLTTYTYTVYAKVPNELADSHQSCVFNLCFDDNFKWGSKKEVSEYKYGYALNIQ